MDCIVQVAPFQRSAMVTFEVPLLYHPTAVQTPMVGRTPHLRLVTALGLGED